MRRTMGVLFVLLSMSGLGGAGAFAQEPPPGSPGEPTSGFTLLQNYPNPFTSETKIPFILGEDLFAEGRPVVVSMRVYNLVQHFVDAPTALRHPAGEGVPLVQLEYTQPGRYEAHWDGLDQNDQEVASGMYFVQLTVNGQPKARRIMKSG